MLLRCRRVHRRRVHRGRHMWRADVHGVGRTLPAARPSLRLQWRRAAVRLPAEV